MKDLIEHFATLARRYDVDYEYTDDHSVWRRGLEQWDEISTLYRTADAATKALLADVWDAVMTARFGGSTTFHWRREE